MRIGFTTAIAVVATLLGALALATPAGAAPANDDIVNAQTVGPGLPVSVAASSVGATGESGETVYGNPATESVWFQWTPSTSTAAIVDLCSSGFTGGSATFGIGVYTGGTTFSSLTKVADIAGPCKLEFSAIAATTYKIQVDFLHAQGKFTFTLRTPQPPANDNFASAQNLGTTLPVSVSGTTIDATWESGEPAALGGFENSRSVWYSWTSPITGHVQLSGCPFETQPGSAANKTIGVYSGTSLGTLTEVVQTSNCTVEFPVTSGSEYKIAFSGSIRGEGTFTLGLRNAPPPTNDDLADATVIGPTLPLAVQGDNSFATIEAGESAVPISGLTDDSHSVWYQWTPSVSERVKLNACRLDQPRLGVFTGTSISSLVVATEPQSRSPYCEVELSAVAGTTYEIAIAGDSFNDGTGPFELEIHKVSRPLNDNFVDAITIGPDLPISIAGNNTDATVEMGEPSPALNYEPIATVWYRWDSNFNGPVDISTCGSETSDFVSVHTGSTFAAMNRVVPSGEDEPGACDLAQQAGSIERFVSAAGTTYWIQVSSLSRGIEGPFRLTIIDPNAKPSLPPVIVPVVTKSRSGLKRAIEQCEEKFTGKGRKSLRKRADCIKKARRKAAIARCHKIANPSQRKRCIQRARKPS
ncbi:MAG: hypothetical protein WB507_00900 [Solirubrobacterales bacterium]